MKIRTQKVFVFTKRKACQGVTLAFWLEKLIHGDGLFVYMKNATNN